MELLEKVSDNVLRHKLLSEACVVLVSVSGGVDSMVLLHFLHELAPKNKWSLAVAHFNHGLRGKQSDADEEFVQAIAEAMHLPFYGQRGDVRALAERSRLSIEMAGRELRHRFLIQTATAIGAERIALAHHADDQVETFWLRLLRGNLGAGLAGMRWIRRAAEGETIKFVRPLLNVRKEELIRFAQEKRIAFREDESNADPKFLRNRVRLEVLPRLEAFQPELRELSVRTAQVLADEKDFLEFQGRDWLKYRRVAFEVLHVALQREIVRQQLVGLGINPTFELIERLRLTSEEPIAVPSAGRISRSGEGLLSKAQSRIKEFSAKNLVVDLTDVASCEFADVQIVWEEVDTRGMALPGTEYFDLDTIGRGVVIRTWAPGDKFQPSGMSAEAKVQDLLTNLKVGASEKRGRVVAVAEDGKLFWVEGLRISERHKVTGATRRVLKWTWRRIA